MADVDWVRGAIHSLSHRGPDASGFTVSDDGRAVLGHTRLAIIDLSPGANQPMSGAGGSLLSFNGEIYNFRDVRDDLTSIGYRCSTESDTEVVLAGIDSWGDSVFGRLEGMFALGHYEPASGTLLLARDPLGQKPLYFMTLEHDALAFASELNVLLPLLRERRLSVEALADYLRFGYSMGQSSLAEGIHKVPPGAMLTWRSGHMSETRYWSPPEPDVDESLDDEALLDALEERMSTAVKRTLVSDVPVGVLLSGGIDSSTIAALAVRSQADIRTYSVEFPGHPVDEGEMAAAIAARLGTAHTRLEAPTVDVGVLLAILENQDEPIADPSVIPTSILFEAISRDGRVVLGGDGGDELFAGYEHYRRLLMLERPLWRATSPVRRAVGDRLLEAVPPGMKGRFWLEVASRPATIVGPPLNRLFLDGEIRALLTASASAAMHPVQWEKASRGDDYLDRLQRADLRGYLPNDILHKVDRCSMRYSVEARAPFLDTGVVEFAMASVPPRLKMDGRDSKIILRRLRSRLIGDDFALGRKQGFSPPLHALLQEQRIREALIDIMTSAPEAVWSRTELDKWVAMLRSGDRVSWQVFALAALISWQVKWNIASVAA